MLWACVVFPELALDALRDARDEPDAGTPRAIIDGPAQRRQVVLANAPARRLGVRGGQPVAAAQALCPNLLTQPRNSSAESELLTSLADWGCRFSTDVAIGVPDTIWIEIGGSLKLFDGWPALERRMRSELQTLGHAHRIAVAPTAAAARVLAGCADGTAIMRPAPLQQAVNAVALADSGLDSRTVTDLIGMGFRHLREVLRLPRAELARRIGEEAMAHLDRLRGAIAETLPRHRPRTRYARRFDFDHGIESTTSLRFPLQRAIRELAGFLAMRDGGVQQFSLVLGHERETRTRIDIGLLEPVQDAAALFEYACARLDRITLPAPIHWLALEADNLPPLCPLHRDLFDSARTQTLTWPVLAERLRMRLGDDALRRLDCVADHRPEHAWRFAAPPPDRKPESPARRIRQKPDTQTVAVAAGARPFWLLPRPIPLRPTPTVLAGPERIESGWWDGKDHRRDYYIVQTRSGQRAWAFVPVGATDGWMLHGWFA